MRRIFGLITYIVHAVRPSYHVDNPIIREHVRYKSISLNIMKGYTSNLTTHVESKISRILPDCLALLFDGQTTTKAHYIAVFATFLTKNEQRFDSMCFVLLPLEDETTQNAHKHVQFLSIVIKLFGKSILNIVVFVGDNCNVTSSQENSLWSCVADVSTMIDG